MIPDGETVLNPGELLLSFLDEQLQQLGVGRLGRRSFRAARGRQRRCRGAHRRQVRSRPGRRRQARNLHGARIGAGFERRDRGDGRGRLLLERLHTRLGVVEHVPGVRASRLHRLHVVLEADDRVRETVHEARRQHVNARLHDAPQLRGDRLDDLHRARLAEQQQTRLHAAHQVLPAVEARRIERATDALRHGFLDTREVDDALAQHRRLHLLKFAVHGGPRQPRIPRQDHADQLAVELVLDTDQGRGDLDQRGFIGLERAVDDLLQPLGLALHVGAQLAEAEHPEGIADLAQHLDLRAELLRLAGAAAHENVEDVLDLAEILADRRGHRPHELDARRRQVLALLLDALVDRQQLGETERGAHRAHPCACGLGTPDVIQQIIEQLDRR